MRETEVRHLDQVKYLETSGKAEKLRLESEVGELKS